MQNMKVNYIITTVALKMIYDDRVHYVIDTYARLTDNDNDNIFIDKFMKEYAGNGIDKITIIDKTAGTLYIDTFTELENIYNKLSYGYDDNVVNTTILNY